MCIISCSIKLSYWYIIVLKWRFITEIKNKQVNKMSGVENDKLTSISCLPHGCSAVAWCLPGPILLLSLSRSPLFLRPSTHAQTLKTKHDHFDRAAIFNNDISSFCLFLAVFQRYFATVTFPRTFRIWKESGKYTFAPSDEYYFALQQGWNMRSSIKIDEHNLCISAEYEILQIWPPVSDRPDRAGWRTLTE